MFSVKRMVLIYTYIILLFFLLITFHYTAAALSFNVTTLPYQHPNPESVALDVQSRVNASLTRRQMLSTTLKDQVGTSQCLNGNPIDDCWKCDPNWANNRQHLADCAIGFGQGALGGKGGQFYVVSDSSDNDMVNPTPGTLRHAVIQDVPLWIVFATSMQITLKHELIMNSFKTIDGRGANIEITGGGCITVKDITNVIIHNIHIHDCVPTGNVDIRSSPSYSGHRGRSDGDGITIYSSRNIWIDHCSLSHCTDGLIDATMGSTAITISNNYFTHHDKVMLLGHEDTYLPDSGMQVTVAFNRFGEGLVQRMPRCRRGYFHVVNNDYTQWEMYAVGGSASPTINSQGNRYTAPADPNSKEVTKRIDTDEREWRGWNWRTDGDILVNGAFFVPSGEVGLSTQYAKAYSFEPKSAVLIDQLTSYAGCFGVPIDSGSGPSTGGGTGRANPPPVGYGGGTNPPPVGYGGGANPPPVGYGGGTNPPPVGYGGGANLPPAGYGGGANPAPVGYGGGANPPPAGYGGGANLPPARCSGCGGGAYVPPVGYDGGAHTPPTGCGGDSDGYGMIYSSGASPSTLSSPKATIFLSNVVILIFLHLGTTNHGALLP